MDPVTVGLPKAPRGIELPVAERLAADESSLRAMGYFHALAVPCPWGDRLHSITTCIPAWARNHRSQDQRQFDPAVAHAGIRIQVLPAAEHRGDGHRPRIPSAATASRPLVRVESVPSGTGAMRSWHKHLCTDLQSTLQMMNTPTYAPDPICAQGTTIRSSPWTTPGNAIKSSVAQTIREATRPPVQRAICITRGGRPRYAASSHQSHALRADSRSNRGRRGTRSW